VDIKDARLLMTSFDVLVEQLNLPFYVAEHYCDADEKDAVFAAFANLISEIDYDVLPKLISRFPELKEDIRRSQDKYAPRS
jgi:hypothetical protein